MTATVRSAGSGNSGANTATTFSPTMPVGFVAGDLLLGFACASDGTAPATRPSGSTSIQFVTDGALFSIDVVRKVAVGSDVFTWTIGAARKWAGAVVAITAGTYDTVAPTQGNVGTAQGTTASTTFSTGNSTPGNADSLLICAFGARVANTWTCTNITPTMTELADATSTGTTPASCGVYRSNTPPAVGVIARTATSTLTSADGCGFIIFVNPAPVIITPWLQRSPRPMEQSNVAGPYAAPASYSQIF